MKDDAIRRTNAISKHPGDMKNMWREIKRFWPHLNKSSVKPKDFTGDSSQKNLANKFKDFFSNIGTPLQEMIPETKYCPDITYPPVFELREIDAVTISDLIRDLSLSTSYGTDRITSRLLKLACPYVLPVILHLCNISIRNKCFPDLWKPETITPLSFGNNLCGYRSRQVNQLEELL